MPIDALEVDKALRDIRKKSGDDLAAAHERAIAYLRLQLSMVEDKEEAAYLYHGIAAQHALYRYVDEEEKARQEILNLFPEDPQSWINASGFYMYERCEPQKAVDLATKGLQTAERAGQFVVHACNTLCRAAKLKGDYQLMEKTILHLLSLKSPDGPFDSAYECDFLKNIPEGAVSELLVRRLRALCG